MTPALLLAAFYVPDRLTLQLVGPELVLVATIALLLLVPLLIGKAPRVMGVLTLLGAVIAGLLAWQSLGVLGGTGQELFGIDLPDLRTATPGMLVADPLVQVFRVLLMAFLVGIVLMWFSFEAERENDAPEFFTLLVSSAIGMTVMVASVNLLIMAIAIELASMPSYALAAFDRRRRLSAEAGLKYVVFGAVTSGFMIYGISLLFGLFGTLHVPTLAMRIAAAEPTGATFALLCFGLLSIFAGIGFKIAAVPLHYWCPDVFEGAPLTVTTWLSVASKAAGIVLLLRLVAIFSAPEAPLYARTVIPVISGFIALIAILTCTAANLMAYRQTNVRRLLAYSSIAHAGYMLCAAAVVAPLGQAAALGAVFAYLLIYLFMNLGAFAAIGVVAADADAEDLSAFRQLGWRDPMTAAALTVCLVSLVGLPPLGGFIVKFWLIYALGGTAMAVSGWSQLLLWSLVVVIAVNTAISLFYYARVIAAMYLDPPREARPARVAGPVGGKLIVLGCAVVLLLTGTVLAPQLKYVSDNVQMATPTVTAEAPPAGGSAVAAMGQPG